MFLPPYSPQLNPIEELFSKEKNSIKRSNPNSIEELNNSINGGCASITFDDCMGFFRNTRSYAVKALTREAF